MILARLLLFCALLFSAGSYANQIWLEEVNEVNYNNEISASINMRYHLTGDYLNYTIDLVNKSEKIIFVPPLKNKNVPPYKEIEPFFDIYLKVDGKWILWIKNERIMGEWDQYETGMAYHRIFLGGIGVDKNSGVISVDGPDGDRIASLPKIPEALKLVMPYKIGNNEKQAEFILNQNSFEQYRNLLSEKINNR